MLLKMLISFYFVIGGLSVQLVISYGRSSLKYCFNVSTIICETSALQFLEMYKN